jgi:folate-binding protein YgfZ
VKLADESASWVQDGIWDADFSQPDVAWRDGVATVRVGERRYIQLGPALSERANATEEDWVLRESQAGRPFISSATQDKFVPQMVNLEKLGGVDFQKGCYPGQEIVARAQYRGQVKRRMVQMQGAARPGEEFNGGTVVDAARGELLVVAPV